MVKVEYDFYLAGPMRGYPDGNKKTFIKAAEYLRSLGYSVWNPAEQNDRSMKFSACMINDIDAVINQCRAIALLPGWRESLGANVETICAYVCGKDVYLIEYPKLALIQYQWEFMNLVLPFNPGSTGFRSFQEINKKESEVLS